LNIQIKLATKIDVCKVNIILKNTTLF
jgi:hypothetical protein